jgi:hypothetical protein
VVVSAPFALLGQSRLGEQPARLAASPQQPAPQAFIDKMLDMADVGPKDYVVDVGSGDARILIAAARRGANGVGFQSGPDMARRSSELAWRGMARAVTKGLVRANQITIFVGDVHWVGIVSRGGMEGWATAPGLEAQWTAKRVASGTGAVSAR